MSYLVQRADALHVANGGDKYTCGPRDALQHDGSDGLWTFGDAAPPGLRAPCRTQPRLC